MKKLLRLFMLAALFLPFAVNAQLSAIYQFSTGIDNTQWYTLTSDFVMLLDAASFEPSETATTGDSWKTELTDIGFTFNFAGVDYTQFSANSDGTVRLGSTVIGTSSYTTPFSASNANQNNPKICGLGCDGCMVFGDYIAYQLFGTAGNRVAVIEISTGTYTSATRSNHYTFQIQLAEANNSVTLIYSPAAPAAGPAATYQLGACTSASDIVLFNVANNTMSIYTSGTSANNASGTWPAPGRYYTITPDPNACYPVTGLTASNITATGATLTWADTNNTGATYSVYNGETLLASGITGNTYDVTGLSANTSYVFYVIANCSGDNASNAANVSVHTACGPQGLPWTCSFEENEIVSTTAATALPWCSERYVSTASSGTTYPYSYNSNPHTGNRSLYFYGTTSSSYPDTMAIILPEIDVTNYPMSGNRVTFWVKMYTASSSKNIYVGTMTNPADMTTFTLVESVLVSGNTYTLFSVPLTTASATAPYVALMVLKGTGTMCIDDMTLEVLPACFKVSNVVANGITANSVTLTWVDNQNTNASYSIYIADSLVGTSSTTTYTVTGLESNTEYTFGVVSNCANGDGTVVTVTARTACEAMALPWTCSFEADELQSTSLATALPWCSYRYSSPATTPNYPYSCNYPHSSHSGSHSLCYGTTSSSHPDTMVFVLPEVDVTTFPMNNNRISFWGKSYFNHNMVYVYTMTNPTDFNTAALIDSVDVSGSTFTKYTVQLNTASATVPYVAVMSRMGWLFLDDMTLEVLPACLEVISTSVTATTENAITLSWVPNSVNTSATFTIYNMADSSVVADNLTGTTYTVDNLSANTQYTFGVQANCPAGDAVIVTVSGRTDCGVMPLPYTETFEATNGTISCWTIDGPGSWTVGVGDYSAATGAFEGSQNAKIVHGVTGNVTKYISPALDGVQSCLVLDFAYVLRDWDGDVDELRVYGRAAADSAWQMYGEYTTATGTWTTQTVIIPGTVYQVAFEYTDNWGYGLGVDSVVFTPGDYCYQVSDLMVGDATANSVTLTWKDDNNTGATYTIYNMADNTIIAANVTGTSYEVTGLTASTGYTFGVAANCSADNQSSIEIISAVTDCANGSCLVTIVGADPYSGSWNGNAINIIQNGNIIDTFTLTTGSSLTESYSVCSGIPVSFSWVSGNYPDGVSFEIIDGGNNTVFTGAGSSMTAGEFLTLNEPCPSCITPLVSLDNITEISVTLNWAGSADSYDLYQNGTFVANVTTNTYTFSGLTVATDYIFGVQAICSATDSSAMATVNAMTSCADVITLPYYEGFENGLGCWMTINASADGQPWSVINCSSLTITNNPHGGAYVASSWSFRGYPMHANAWLISPKFVLPNTTDSLSFSWWDITNTHYPDHYSVVLSTTTNNTAAFTTLVYPNTTPAGDWTMRTIDLTSYAGQSVYIAFHHLDYDKYYLFIDDISLYKAGQVVTDPTIATQNVVLYPNPAKEVINVECTMNNVQFEVETVEVYDVYGKLINTVNVIDNLTRINVSNLANGMYFVRVNTEAGMVTKTFVKR